MMLELRALTEDDRPAAWTMSRLAFGGSGEAPASWHLVEPGRRGLGGFDGDGRLVAKAMDREQAHWYGGRLVPACGVAGVAVLPELRGTGLGRQLLTGLLEQAYQRGAVISTLFRTTPGPYRRLGWEEQGALRWTTVPTPTLAGRTVPPGSTLRPAAAGDVPAIRAAYRTVARAGTGLLHREGPLYDRGDQDYLDGFDGVSVAVGADGTLEGFATWRRGTGYDAASTLTVPDLVGLTERAVLALLSMLGTWADVAPTLVLRLAEHDPAALLANLTGFGTRSTQPWMLRVVDAAGAVQARGWPVHLTGSLELDLVDEACPWNAGPHVLSFDRGQGQLEKGGSGSVRVQAGGLALLYGGAADPAVVRRAGLLDGGDERDDALLRAATAGPVPTLLDYF